MELHRGGDIRAKMEEVSNRSGSCSTSGRTFQAQGVSVKSLMWGHAGCVCDTARGPVWTEWNVRVRAVGEEVRKIP